MRSCFVVRSLALACFLVVIGCSGDPSSSRARTPIDPEEAGTGGAVAPDPTVDSCIDGQQSCDCPDGRHNGLQLCAAEGLLPCECYEPVTGGAVATPVPVAGQEVERLCPDLQGVASCDARSYLSEAVPASLLFVLDRSGSMACNPPPTQSVEDCNTTPAAKDPTAPTRWTITVEALSEAFATLEGSDASAGLELFSVDGACGVNSRPSVGVKPITGPQLDTLQAALGAFEPRGGTPIVGATILAYAHLHQEITAPGNRYVVLITDGEESCGYGGNEEDVEDLAAARRHLLEVEVQKARDANIRTFVIGAPGSEGARGFLSELAFRGGTARGADCVHGDPDAQVGDCHFDLTQGGDFGVVLRGALGEISGQAARCEFATPPGGSARINVQYASGGGAPSCFAHVAGPCDGSESGWQFPKDPSGADDLSRVVLCGTACDEVRADPTAAVDVILGCDVLE